MVVVAHRIIESPQVPCTGIGDFLGSGLIGTCIGTCIGTSIGTWTWDLGLTITKLYGTFRIYLSRLESIFSQKFVLHSKRGGMDDDEYIVKYSEPICHFESDTLQNGEK